MKLKTLFYILLSTLMSVSFACNKIESESSDSNPISESTSSVVGILKDAFSDTNTSGVGNVALNKIYIPKKFLETQSFGEKLYVLGKRLFKENDLYAAYSTISCPGGGNIYITDITTTWNNSSATTFTLAKNFNNCQGIYGNFQLSGYAVLNWSNLLSGTGAAKINFNNTSGTILQQAPVNKKITHLTTGRYVITNGLGTQLADATDPYTGTFTITPVKVAHTISFLTGPSFSIAINLERKGYSSTGTLLFNHKITTSLPLTVAVDLTSTPKTRTVNGTYSLQHVLAGYTVTFSLTNVVFHVDDNEATSGTISFTFTGTVSGSGTITFNNDVGTYDFTFTSGKHTSGTFDL